MGADASRPQNPPSSADYGKWQHSEDRFVATPDLGELGMRRCEQLGILDQEHTHIMNDFDDRMTSAGPASQIQLQQSPSSNTLLDDHDMRSFDEEDSGHESDGFEPSDQAQADCSIPQRSDFGNRGMIEAVQAVAPDDDHDIESMDMDDNSQLSPSDSDSDSEDSPMADYDSQDAAEQSNSVDIDDRSTSEASDTDDAEAEQQILVPQAASMEPEANIAGLFSEQSVPDHYQADVPNIKQEYDLMQDVEEHNAGCGGISGHSTPPSTPPPTTQVSRAGSMMVVDTAGLNLESKLKFERFPNDRKDISKHLRYYQKIHDKAMEARPRLQLASHRYSIVVVPEGRNPHLSSSDKRFIYFKGNRLTTVETIKHKYGIVTASTNFRFLLGRFAVYKSDTVEELDLFRTKLVVLSCFSMDETRFKATKLGDGLVKPETESDIIVSTEPVVIIDDD